MGNNSKYPYDDWRELHGAKKEALDHTLERIKDTITGAVKGVASDHINNNGNFIYGDAERQRQQTSGEIAAWQDTVSAYEDALRDPASTRNERETARTMIDDLQRRIDAYNAAYGVGGATERAAENVWKLADKLDDSGKLDIANAKQGLGTFGQGLVDLGVLGVETGSDLVAAPIAALYGKLFRLVGRDSQTARRSGADFGSAMAYGGASGFSAAAIETLANGLNGMYGEKSSGTKEEAEKIYKQMGLSEAEIKRIEARRNDFGEGFEAILTDLSNQAFKSIYNEKSVAQNLKDTDGKTLHDDAVINAILAMLINEKDN